MAAHTRTETRPVARDALAVGDFLFLNDGPGAGTFVLVVGRTGTLHARVLYNNGRVLMEELDCTVHVAVGLPVEDFDPADLEGYVIEQEAEVRAARDRAERLRLAAEAARQTRANQPGAAAEFARVIGHR
jgi:hypothetical protein